MSNFHSVVLQPLCQLSTSGLKSCIGNGLSCRYARRYCGGNRTSQRHWLTLIRRSRDNSPPYLHHIDKLRHKHSQTNSIPTLMNGCTAIAIAQVTDTAGNFL